MNKTTFVQRLAVRLTVLVLLVVMVVTSTPASGIRQCSELSPSELSAASYADAWADKWTFRSTAASTVVVNGDGTVSGVEDAACYDFDPDSDSDGALPLGGVDATCLVEPSTVIACADADVGAVDNNAHQQDCVDDTGLESPGSSYKCWQVTSWGESWGIGEGLGSKLAYHGELADEDSCDWVFTLAGGGCEMEIHTSNVWWPMGVFDTCVSALVTTKVFPAPSLLGNAAIVVPDRESMDCS